MSSWRRIALALLATLLVSATLAIGIAPLARHGELALGSGLRLLAPGALWLLAFLPLLALARVLSLVEPGAWSRLRGLLALALRLALVALVIVALARPARMVAGARPCTVLVADVSASIDDRTLAREQAILDSLQRSAAGDAESGMVHVVSFAERPRPLPAEARDAALARAPSAEGEQSDPAAAIALAPALCEPGAPARALLISDGNQTRGDLLAAATSLAGRMRLDALALGGEAPRLRVVSLAAPATAMRSAPFVVEAEVESPRAQRVAIEITRAGRIERREVVTLPVGLSHHPLRIELAESGAALLEARVVPLDTIAADPTSRDDQAVAALVVQGRPRVLYADGDATAGTPLVRLLGADGFEVETRAPSALPTSAPELARYDLLVLSDVEAAALGHDRMAAISEFVEGGGGLLFAGGERVHGAGGYQGSVLERLLPVRFDIERRHEDPRLALVLAIDRSGSMEGEKLAVAKEAARATAALLGPDDLLGIVAFDTQATAVVSLQPARNRRAIDEGIARLQAGGGTSFLSPLRAAYQQLAGARAAVRHVILLTDGQASYDGLADLCEKMAREAITVSAVGVGSGADRTLLSMIAERGGGRFFFADDPESVPQIFVRETRAAAGSALVEESTRVRVARPSRVLAGVEIASAPRLRGYVVSRPAEDAEVTLVSERGDPIMAQRRVGAGQVTAWTSDVKSRWAADWLAWPGWARLWVQLARATMRPQPTGGAPGHEGHEGSHGASSRLGARVDRDRLLVEADVLDADERLPTPLASSLQITELPAPAANPIGKSIHPNNPAPAVTPTLAPMTEVAPGRYRAEIAIDPRDQTARAWVLHALHRGAGGDVIAASTATLSRPRPLEHARPTPDEPLLRMAAERTGGHLLDPRAPSLEPLPPAPRSAAELRSLLLLIAAALLCLDLAARRLPAPRAGQPRPLTVD